MLILYAYTTMVTSVGCLYKQRNFKWHNIYLQREAEICH